MSEFNGFLVFWWFGLSLTGCKLASNEAIGFVLFVKVKAHFPLHSSVCGIRKAHDQLGIGR
ncbi:hypothetical protein [Vibrio alginolyticus]|uniref:hypothetical protein n=1 Tax=Vibrio alginolyticus TaxID=663 RepID=UPI00211A6411|nr:hypothetical protein [Vibrio alginolyticus]MCQ9059435.1 hypothetical protein [Vibrio alginolyticus]